MNCRQTIEQKLLKIKNWTKCMQNREQWRTVEKVKTLKE
jgi:hypothetical protein